MNEQRWQDWATTLVGTYVFLSPWIIQYFFPASSATTVVGWSHHVVGLAIVAMGMAALASYQFWEEWVDIVLGVWLIVSPWVLGFTNMAALAWNSVAMGIVVLILSAGALFTGFDTRRIT